MPEPAVIDTPVEPKQEIINNPVIPEDADFSKLNFKAEMEKATGVPVEPANEPEPPAKEKVAPKEETKPEVASAFPEELLTGKPAETKVDATIAEIDAMVLPKNAKPEQVASFGKLKEAARKAIEEKLSRITELEGKTAQGASTAELQSALEKARAAEEKAQKLEEKLNRDAFEKSDAFKSQFTDREAAAVEGAKSYLEGTEINPGVIDMALHAQGAKRGQILRDAGVEPEMIALISPHLANYDNLQRDKAKELEGWKIKAEAMQQQETQKAEQTKAQRQQEEEKVWSSVISTAEHELLPLRKVESNAPWNEQADTLKQEARRIFNGEGVPLGDMAKTITKGVAYDVLSGMFSEVVAQLNSTKAENAKLKSSRPGAADTTGVKTTTTAPVSEDERRKGAFNDALAQVRAN